MYKELKEAIEKRYQIVFRYEKEGSAEGERIGNPHIVFHSTKQKNIVHIYKISGVKTDPNEPLPGWRAYNVENLRIVEVREDCRFNIEKTFKPSSRKYTQKIYTIS